MHDPYALAEALRTLRRRQGFQQAEVAQRMERSPATVSRLEQDGVNPQWQTLLRYLEAIDITLSELDAELSQSDEATAALDQQLEREAKRLEAEPGYRRLAAGMLRRFGGEELPPGMLALAELLDEHGERLHRIERQIGEDSDQPEPNGTDGRPAQS